MTLLRMRFYKHTLHITGTCLVQENREPGFQSQQYVTCSIIWSSVAMTTLVFKKSLPRLSYLTPNKFSQVDSNKNIERGRIDVFKRNLFHTSRLHCRQVKGYGLMPVFNVLLVHTIHWYLSFCVLGLNLRAITDKGGICLCMISVHIGSWAGEQRVACSSLASPFGCHDKTLIFHQKEPFLFPLPILCSIS